MAPHRVLSASVVFCCTFFGSVLFAEEQTLPLEIGDPRIGPPDNPLNVNSGAAHISRSGVFVGFHCFASNIVVNDTNGLSDVFLLNRRTGGAQRVSVNSDGSQGNGASFAPKVSGNGRFVVFQSGASNLVDGDTNGKVDVFMHDVQTGMTTRISVRTNGTQGNQDSTQAVISANGRYVAFSSGANNLIPGDSNARIDVFLRDTLLGTTSLVSCNALGLPPIGGDSLNPSISDDGRYISFESRAYDITVGDFNSTWDVYVYDTVLDVSTRASLTHNGREPNGFCVGSSISADGSRVAFLSAATNLVTGDTNNAWDAFVRDLTTETISRASVATDGTQSNGLTQYCAISGDGSTVSLRSFASNLVSGDTNLSPDIFLRHLANQTTIRASINENDTQANDDCYEGQLGTTGDFVVFVSEATNLNPQANEPNVFRVFVRGLGLPELGDVNQDGELNGDDIQGMITLASQPTISYDELTIVDFNGDGVLSEADMAQFAQCLIVDCSR